MRDLLCVGSIGAGIYWCGDLSVRGSIDVGSYRGAARFTQKIRFSVPEIYKTVKFGFAPLYLTFKKA